MLFSVTITETETLFSSETELSLDVELRSSWRRNYAINFVLPGWWRYAWRLGDVIFRLSWSAPRCQLLWPNFVLQCSIATETGWKRGGWGWHWLEVGNHLRYVTVTKAQIPLGSSRHDTRRHVRRGVSCRVAHVVTSVSSRHLCHILKKRTFFMYVQVYKTYFMFFFLFMHVCYLFRNMSQSHRIASFIHCAVLTQSLTLGGWLSKFAAYKQLC